jgi:rhodanese-related sulfurtransferase
MDAPTMPSFLAISVEQLARLVGTPKAPVLLDVRAAEAFAADPFLIPASRHLALDRLEALVPSLLGRPVVVTCLHGGPRSHGAAALLRQAGVDAEVLDGGFVAWRDKQQPVVPAALANGGEGGTLWVTRARPKIDRIACPWLIRRFLDPQARFLFVPPSEVAAVAERFGAVAFDVEGVLWSHAGDRCSFETMVDGFGLAGPVLNRLGLIVRGADTGRPDLAPEAAGLLAMSLGLSRQYNDDLEQLDAGMALYDALYRWARDASTETHEWIEGRQK